MDTNSADLEEGLDKYGVDDKRVVSSPGDVGIEHVDLSVFQRVGLFGRRNQGALCFFGTAVTLVFVLLLTGVLLVSFATQSSAPVTVPQWDSYRLPPHVVPERYALNLTVDVENGVTRGLVAIRVSVLASTDFVVIHAGSGIRLTRALLVQAPLKGVKTTTATPESNYAKEDFDAVFGDEATRKRAQVGDVFMADNIIYDALHEYFKLQWSQLGVWTKASSSDYYLIGLDWQGTIIEGDMVGIYKSTYTDANNNKEILASTDMEPTRARYMMPCFDEPDKKAYFTVNVFTSSKRKVLSNTAVASVTTARNGLTLTSFYATPRMSTYLLCIVVSKFEAVEKDGHATAVKVYARPESKSQGNYAVGFAADVLDQFAKYFDVTYPLQKLDLVAIPDFAPGAMENWGLVTFRETALLYDPQQSSTLSQQYVARVVAHELAHQWFGNLVTMRWWNDIWLNEGFASYMEYWGVDHVHPDWKIWEHFIVDDYLTAMSADALASTHAIMAPVAETPEQISALFGAIIYDKGASVLRMLDTYLESKQPGSFVRGLRRYLKQFSYSNAATMDLWNALQAESGVDVAALMHPWTSKPGYPILTVVNTTYTVRFMQKRFMINAPPTPGNGFAIPFEFIVGTNASSNRFQVYMGETQEVSDASQVYLGDNTLLVNPDRRSFFRVCYTTDQVQRLVEDASYASPLQTGGDVVALMDDLMSISLASTAYCPVSIKQLLSLASNVLRNPVFGRYVVVRSAVRRLLDLGKRADRAVEMNATIAGLISPLLNAIGLDPMFDDPRDTLLRRSYLFVAGVLVRLPNVVNTAYEKFVQIQAGDHVSPDLRQAAYIAGMVAPQAASSLQQNFNWLFQRYRSASVSAADRELALAAIGYAPDQTLLFEALSRSLDESYVRRQDLSTLFSSVASSSSLGAFAAWHFLRANYDGIRQIFVFRLSGFVNLVKYVAASYATTAERMEEVKSVLEFKNFNPTQLAGLVDTMQATVRWNAAYATQVQQWLEGNR